MLRRLKSLWLVRSGHQLREVGRVYEGPEDHAQEVVLEACRICELNRDRPLSGDKSVSRSALTQRARLEFQEKSRHRALRRTKRKRI